MDTNSKKVKNSDILTKTLISLINVASSKTTNDYAWSIIKNLISELRSNHIFLKYVHINDIKRLNYNKSDITIMSNFNDIDSKKIGIVIQNIIDTFKTKMGTKAGYFFLTEFKHDVGEEFYNILEEMGVDLRLIDLQNKIYGWDNNYKIKEKSGSNIAYLEKN